MKKIIGTIFIYTIVLSSCIMDIMFCSKTPNNIVGIPFISKFNWIIDFKNKKIYAQHRHNLQHQNNAKPLPLYIVDVIENQLMITVCNKTANPSLKLNTVITSVNGEQISVENRCFFMNLLNKTADWAELNIETTK